MDLYASIRARVDMPDHPPALASYIAALTDDRLSGLASTAKELFATWNRVHETRDAWYDTRAAFKNAPDVYSRAIREAAAKGGKTPKAPDLDHLAGEALAARERHVVAISEYKKARRKFLSGVEAQRQELHSLLFSALSSAHEDALAALREAESRIAAFESARSLLLESAETTGQALNSLERMERRRRISEAFASPVPRGRQQRISPREAFEAIRNSLEAFPPECYRDLPEED